MQAHAEEGDIAGALAHLQGAVGPAGPGLRHGAVEGDRGARRAHQARRLRHGRSPIATPCESARRTRRSAGSSKPGATPAIAGVRRDASAKPRLVLQPFAMHGIDAERAHLVQGFSLHLAATLVRFREWSVVDRPPAAVVLPEARLGAAILHRDHRLPGRRRDQHGDGAQGRLHRHLRLERKLRLA